MKLRYFIAALSALLVFTTSCEEESTTTLLDEIQVSSSYVALAAQGNSVKVTVTATDAWTLGEQPDWLTVTPTSGQAGETEVTFTADAATETREAEVQLTCAGKVQRINVIQVTEKTETPLSTCAEVIAGPDSKTYRVTGVCTRIANTQYGNWYLEDATGSIYIYGTVDATGAYNWSSFGIEVGDEVTVEGPKTTYNGTVELVDASVISVSKSLIKVEDITPDTLALEGGEAVATLTCKGNGVSVVIPEDAQSWLSVTGIVPSGTSVAVTFRAAANEGGDRATTLTFNTTDGKKNYSSQATLFQKGAILEVSVADFLAAEVGTAQYKVSGIITKVAKASYGNIYVKDATGEMYVYGVGSKGDFEALGLKEGDIVTLIGARGEYKGSAQMTGAQYESHTPVTTLPINEFVAKEDSKNDWYRITGVVRAATDEEVAAGCKNDMETYGNFVMEDETGSVYVYGVTTGYNGVSKQFGTLGVAYGDTLTVVSYKTSYKGLIEAGGAMYVSHAAAK